MGVNLWEFVSMWDSFSRLLFCFRHGQFRHSRLKDHPNMQVSNPIYMPQTTEDLEDEEDQSRQPLDQPFDFDPEKVNLLKKMSLY